MGTEISIVIPVYNEEGNIRPLVSSLLDVMKKINKEYEILFVNDGSTDSSGQILTEITNSHDNLTIINLDKNYGLTSALDAGFKAAIGDFIVTLDADLQNDPADIPMLLDKIKSFDMVCGWRHDRDDPWIKLLSSKIANFARNRLSNEEVKDSACTLKAFRKDCLNRIKLYRGLHRFLPTLFRMEGFSVTEVKVRHNPRKSGKSKFNIRNRIFSSFIDLLVIIWMKKRLLNYKIITSSEITNK
ncbi:MAG: glycosyltransferase family 2 protein [Candidatus Anammoxibacter sp.]